MKCPACKREMRKGYFRHADQPVQWIPDGNRPSIWKTGVAKDAIVLSDESCWSGYRADAFYCPTCKFVVVPVE